MYRVRSFSLATSGLLLSLLACDQSRPVEPSAEPLFQTALAPSGTSAVAVSESRIDVSWRDNSSNETGFEVHRSTAGATGAFALLASRGAGITAHSDQGLAPITEYCYKVRTFRTTGSKTSYSEFSSTACATTPAPPAPAAPSGTDARPTSSTAVAVTWIDGSTTEEGFRVQRSLDGGSTWTNVGVAGPNIRSIQDAERVTEQPVCYRVIAFNAGGESSPSSTDCTTPPAAPSGLTAMEVDGSGIDLTWTDNSAVEDGYEVRRATIGVSFSAVAHLPANSTSYRDVGTTSNSTYWYQVRASSDGGFSDVSNTAGVGTCVTATVEECGNGFDDDCDGLVDTDDVDCQCFAYPCPQGYICDGWTGLCLPDPYCAVQVQTGDESDLGNGQRGGQP